MQPPQRNPGKPLQLWFQDEARVGNKGRVCHRWWLKGERAPGRAQQGYQWAYIFAAIRPTTGEDCTLVPPVVSAAVMALFLAQFAATLPADAPAGRCPCRPRARRRWLARRARPRRPRQSHAGAAAGPQPGTQSGRAGLALPAPCASASCRCASAPIPRPLSRPAAEPGTPSPQKPAAFNRSAPIPGSQSSLHKLAGISAPLGHKSCDPRWSSRGLPIFGISPPA